MKLPFKHLLLMVLMVATAAIASVMRPTVKLSDERPTIDLEAMVPTQFGGWRQQLNVAMQVVNPEQQETLEAIYTQTLSRIYLHSSGYRIMLSIAYGNDQSDQLQLHKPEVCYPAQGFKLDQLNGITLDLQYKSIPATTMLTHLGQRNEPVTYWTVVGDHITTSSVNKKLTEMRYGLRGRIPDGMLVRVSSVDREPQRAHRLQAEFAAAMVAAIAPEHRGRFAGLDPQTPTVSTGTQP
jgi:EpsI family protein